MKALHHKAKLAFLMREETPALFFQLEDGRILVIDISELQLAGFVADGALRIVRNHQHDAHEYTAARSSDAAKDHDA